MSGSGASRALAAEAARRSRVCWLSYRYADGADVSEVTDRLVWHAWHDDALLVLSCPGPEAEQVLPGIDRAGPVAVTMRSKDTGGRLVTWTGDVEVVAPDSESWEPVVTTLLGVRLNLPDPQAARTRWATRGTVVRIRPEGPGALP